jgi:3-phosphoshikimate 1-carboxyvinyltransferase
VPADKSIAHRALLFNAMASGEADVTVRRPGADVRSTARALGALGAISSRTDGAKVEGAEAGDGMFTYRVRGGGPDAGAELPGDGGEELDCGNSGTTMRLLSGALAGRDGRVATLLGDESLSRRPMERVAGPLRQMGARVTTTEGHAPLVIDGQRPLGAMHHRLRVASAQVLGAITLAALAADGTTTIESPGPTRDHTERLLAWLGASVRRDGLTTTIDGPGTLRARSLIVPGDISSAAAWLVAAALHPDAELRLVDVCLNPSRVAIVDVLREMGADIQIAATAHGGGGGAPGPEPSGDLVVRGGSPLRAISLSGARVAELIDELPLIAVAMAAADGISELRDASELRVKESDRIALVIRNLAAIGARAEELPDGWRVTSGTALPTEIETAGDHRIAIAFAVAAISGVAGDVTIDDPACVDVSYPGFWDDLEGVAGREPAVAPAR